MSTENLVNIDIESDGIHNEHEVEISGNSNKNSINRNRNYQKIFLSEEDSEIIFCDNNLDECERLHNESQPLLGGVDQNDVHQIIYNQFPSE